MTANTRFALFMTAILTFATDASGDVIYVDAGAAPGGDGSSWPSALDDLHTALGLAGVDDEVWVASGTYAPSPPGGSVTVSFRVLDGVELYGGFAGGEGSVSERDIAANPTVLTGDIDGDDEPGGAGTEQNSHHVVDASYADFTVIDGFIIEAGRADDPDATRGSGILAIESTTSVRNCIIRNNFALDGGGGLSHTGGSLTVRDCEFDRCAAGYGGGLASEHAEVLVIVGTRFEDCISLWFSGALNVNEVTTFICDASSFISNQSAGTAGAAFFNAGGATITGCEFAYNVAAIGVGGGVMLGNGTATLANCLFHHNVADLDGGAPISGDDTVMYNCTVTMNAASLGGGIVDGGGDTPLAVVNSIIWGNTGEQIGGSVAATYCNVEGGYSGAGNISVDPAFVQAGAGDLRLAHGSPCLDAGSNAAVPSWLIHDYLGADRIQNGVVDMGAYEGSVDGGLPAAAMAPDFDPGESAVLTPSSVEFDPLAFTAVVVQNHSEEHDAMFVVEEHPSDLHPEAGGPEVAPRTLASFSSLPDGAFFSIVFMPFDAQDVCPESATGVDLYTYDAATDAWVLAAALNTEPSPGHPGPVGDRLVTIGDASQFETSAALGDYGVFWNPASQRGAVWANTDHVGDYALGPVDCDGIVACDADISTPPDGVVDLADLIILFLAWGDAAGAADLDQDGTVGWSDLLLMIAEWGTCAE